MEFSKLKIFRIFKIAVFSNLPSCKFFEFFKLQFFLILQVEIKFIISDLKNPGVPIFIEIEKNFTFSSAILTTPFWIFQFWQQIRIQRTQKPPSVARILIWSGLYRKKNSWRVNASMPRWTRKNLTRKRVNANEGVKPFWNFQNWKFLEYSKLEIFRIFQISNFYK